MKAVNKILNAYTKMMSGWQKEGDAEKFLPLLNIAGVKLGNEKTSTMIKGEHAEVTAFPHFSQYKYGKILPSKAKLKTITLTAKEFLEHFK